MQQVVCQQWGSQPQVQAGQLSRVLLPPASSTITATGTCLNTAVASAGRRSTDLLHLMLQNLYFMQHVQGYIGKGAKGMGSAVGGALRLQLWM
jgi:hypothetical protein